MGGDPIPGPLDEEHIVDTLIAELKALRKAIPGMILALEAKREAARMRAGETRTDPDHGVSKKSLEDLDVGTRTYAAEWLNGRGDR